MITPSCSLGYLMTQIWVRMQNLSCCFSFHCESEELCLKTAGRTFRKAQKLGGYVFLSAF